MADCASDPGVETESGTEGRDEGGKVPPMILNQSQPFPARPARAALHSPYMVMVFAWRETLGLWIGNDY